MDLHPKLVSNVATDSNPFKIIRTRWNSSPYQSNQNNNGKISNEVPTKFKRRPTYYSNISVTRNNIDTNKVITINYQQFLLYSERKLMIYINLMI